MHMHNLFLKYSHLQLVSHNYSQAGAIFKRLSNSGGLPSPPWASALWMGYDYTASLDWYLPVSKCGGCHWLAYARDLALLNCGYSQIFLG